VAQRALTSAGVKLASLQGASNFCRVESRIHINTYMWVAGLESTVPIPIQICK